VHRVAQGAPLARASTASGLDGGVGCGVGSHLDREALRRRAAASALRVVPDPPWQTTAAAQAKTSACGTQRSTRTFGGVAAKASEFAPCPTVKRTRIGRSATGSSAAS
jgi:hypothetical protein